MDKRQVLTELFNDNKTETLNEISSVLGQFIWGPILWSIYQNILSIRNKKRRRCGSDLKVGREHDLCLVKADRDYYISKLKILQKRLNNRDCDQSCKEKVKSEINKINIKIQKLNDKIQKMEAKIKG